MQTTHCALSVAAPASPGALWLNPLQLCSANLMLVRRVEASCFSLPRLRKSGNFCQTETGLTATVLCKPST